MEWDGIITADHGNAELMIDGSHKETYNFIIYKISTIYSVGDEFKNAELLSDGRLSDIAPTVLSMMKMEDAKGNTGHSLIK